MNNNLISKKLILIFFGLCLIIANFSFISSFDSVLAQSHCPVNTTVTGTSVTFVGELTDMGGDATTAVWFEYSQTIALGQKTSEIILTQTGLYCITISGLLPSTTYYYRAAARNQAGTSHGVIKNFTTTTGPVSSPIVDLKINNSDRPITIPYNSSATLAWTSSHTDSCFASGAWSGYKPISGSESTGTLTFSRTYTFTCSGPGGSASDSVTVNVAANPIAHFAIKKTIRNVSQGTVFLDSIHANPGDVLTFGIVIQTKEESVYDLIIKQNLAKNLIYRGELKVNDKLTTGDIFTGFNVGNLAPHQKITITFRVDVAGAESFHLGQTELINTVSVSSRETSHSDTAKIIVTKGAVAGAVAGTATVVPTGLTNNIFFDSFFLPLLVTILIIWLFKSRLIRFEEWLDLRKKESQKYKAEKTLHSKIAQIKIKEII